MVPGMRRGSNQSSLALVGRHPRQQGDARCHTISRKTMSLRGLSLGRNWKPCLTGIQDQHSRAHQGPRIKGNLMQIG